MAVVALAAMLALALVVLGASSVGAQQPPTEGEPALDIRTTLMPMTVTLGERTNLVITVLHSQELQISARAPERGATVELVEERELPLDLAEDGRAVTTFVLTFAAALIDVERHRVPSACFFDDANAFL